MDNLTIKFDGPKVRHGTTLVKAMPDRGPRRWTIRKCLKTEEIMDYFRSLPRDSLHAITVTLGGNKRIGKLDYKEQYTEMIKEMKKVFKTNGEYKFWMTPELNKSGVIHFHGIAYNMYQNVFTDATINFGSRNRHKESFKRITNIESYIKYILKDTQSIKLKPYHNIRGKDVKRISKIIPKV